MAIQVAVMITTVKITNSFSQWIEFEITL